VDKGDVRGAMRTAWAYELVLDLGDTLSLTLLAARAGDPIYDRMAIRWMRSVDDHDGLELAELRWLADRFEGVRRGDRQAVRDLERFLARGRR
jgi:hypothetical protein